MIKSADVCCLPALNAHLRKLVIIAPSVRAGFAECNVSQALLVLRLETVF